jgi:hypothetical protein
MGHALRFYGDESGSHGKGTYVIAGYMATAYNWEQFKVDWEAALAESPSIPYFHRGPNHHGDKPFDGWDEQTREAKLYRMIRVFEKFPGRIVELSSTIAWGDYEAVKTAPLGEVLSNPYYCCLHGVVSLALQWVKDKGEGADIDFIFDYQFQHQAEAVKQFTHIRQRFSDVPEVSTRMSGICFMDDERVAGLQAADLIAWQLRRDLVKPKEDGGKSRPELEKLRAACGMGVSTKLWNPVGFAQFIERTAGP